VKKQEKNTQFVDYFITRLKSALNLSTDVVLSEYLGVTPQSISNWKARNSIQYDIVFTKCVPFGINLHWLITGDGEMLISNNNNPDSMNCNDCPFKNDVKRYLDDINRYREDIADLKDELRALRGLETPESKLKNVS